MLYTAALVTACLVSPKPGVHAQDAARFEVDFDAPASCPSRAAFERRVRSRLKSEPPAVARRLRVHITLSPHGARGTLSVEGESVASQARTIEARTCAEAVDALALIAALMLDPLQAEAASSVQAPVAAAPVAQPRDQPSADPSAANQASAAPSQAAQENASPPREQARKQSTTGAVDEADESAAPPSADDTKASRRAQGPGTLSATASALLVSGVAPRLRPGFAVSGLMTQPFSRIRMGLRAGVRLALPDEKTLPDGVAALRWWSTHLNACAHITGAKRPVSWMPCLASEFGVLRAQGSRAEAPRSSQRMWGAAGPALLMAWQFSRRFGAFLSAEGLFPFVRDRYLLGRDLVHTVPTLTIRGELGLSVRLL